MSAPRTALCLVCRERKQIRYLRRWQRPTNAAGIQSACTTCSREVEAAGKHARVARPDEWPKLAIPKA